MANPGIYTLGDQAKDKIFGEIVVKTLEKVMYLDKND